MGMASTMIHPSLGFESSGFNVNVWDILGAPNYTLAHEIGHNLGCLHNREDATWTSEYDYGDFSFGKRWMVGNEGYRTVMSYDSSNFAYNNRIPHFSNPNVSYEGVTTGNAGTEDNAKVLTLSAPYTANFRSSVVQGIVTSISSVSIQEESTVSFKVRLAANPAGTLSMSAAISGDQNLILSSPTTLTFDSSNWNIFQTVVISALPDTNTANGTATVTLSANGVNSYQVEVNETDTGNSTTSGYMVGGVVQNELGMGMPGVTMTFSDGSGPLTTDANGSFYIELSNGWSGTITPSRDGYTFSASSININSLSDHSVGHAMVGARSSVLYVDIDATGAGDGTSWTNAYTDLSDAFFAQQAFTEVWVADGTYLPGEIRSSFFLLPPNIPVYGGFNGTETSREQRDPDANPTILSGDIGTSNDNTDNTYHVVVPSSGSVLDGFVISDGYANYNYSNGQGQGAGLWGDSVSFTINDCNFTSNIAKQGGSGVHLNECNATFTNCAFKNNSTFSDSGKGGAAYFEDSNVTISHSLFDTNEAFYDGGAVFAINTTGIFTDNNFTNNLNSQWNGGGAMKLDSSSPVIRNCRFHYNRTQANNYGGAINLESSSPTIENCTFTRNRSESNSAGALYIDSSSSPTLTDNNFYYNYASSQGGAIFAQNQNFVITGGAIVGNWSGWGGAYASYGAVNSTFSNVRILGNEANKTSSANGGVAYFNTGTLGGTFINCEIAGNKANGDGGVFYRGVNRFLNCTIVGNQASSGGVSVLFSGESITLENSIMWANTATQANEIWVNAGAVTANYSLFDSTQSWGTIPVSNNLDSDPTFVDADGADNTYGTEDDDLTLQANSPAVDAGSTSFTNYSSTDIRGLARSGNPDIGANEYVSAGPPSFTSGSSFSAAENQTSVGTLTATDPNGDALTFSISGGVDENLFSLNATSGVLTFLSAPDYENPADTGTDNIYNLTVLVSDGSLSATANLVVTVTDVVENTPNQAPIGLDHLSSLTVAENEVQGTMVGTFQAQDPDGDALTYSLTSGSGDGNNTMFTMETNGTLRTAMEFDYESYQTLSIRVKAMDGNNSSVEGSFTVIVTNVNETPNALDLTSSLTVAENEVQGTMVGTFQAQDPDGDALTYSLTSGSGDGNNTMFTMETNGTLRTAMEFDYESYQMLSIRVKESYIDGNNSSVEGSFTVIVTNVNETPTALDHTSSLTVAENEVQGTMVGTFQAQDPDGDALTYHLTSGVGDGNNTMFSMETNGTLRTAMEFDYESYQTLSIRVKAMDGNNSSVEGSFTVIVTNVNEMPTALDQTSSLIVAENEVLGTVVGTFQAQDPDGDALTYHLTSGVGDGNNTMFSMETNGTLRTAMEFDYESYQTLSIRVKAMDGNNSSVEGAFTVQVTDVVETTPNQAPVGLDYLSTLSVLENQIQGTVVGTFQAQDPDGDTLTYHLTSGSGDGNNTMFTMETNGTLRTAMEFDYESYQTLSIRVKAMDGSNSSVEGAFTVIVLNDLGSVFSVSGGSFSSPYYQFTDGNGQAVDFSSFLFNRGEIYEFKATGISNSHPFMIGESNGDTSSPLCLWWSFSIKHREYIPDNSVEFFGDSLLLLHGSQFNGCSTNH